MEEKQLTERESLEVITAMIAQTRRRYIGDGSILLMWGYLIVIVAVLVWALIVITRNPAWNYLWFAIPLIGGILTPVMARRQYDRSGIKTYSDTVTSWLWTIAGLFGLMISMVCLVLQLGFSINSWVATLVYTLIAMPMAEVAQGLFIKERSLVVGGIVGLTVGTFTLCCIAGGIMLQAIWFMPLFIISFVAMMIIPGHILNHKAGNE